MTNLTTQQTQLLRLAAGADDGAAPAPDDTKMVRALIRRGLIIALPQAEGPSRLLITQAGRAVVAAPETAPGAPIEPEAGAQAAAESEAERMTKEVAAPPATPKGKLGILVTLLRASGGATVEAMAVATGWQFHSVRGAMSGALKKKLGYDIASEKTDAGRIYRIVEGRSA